MTGRVDCSVVDCSAYVKGGRTDADALRVALETGWTTWIATSDLFPDGHEATVCPAHEYPCRGTNVCSTCALPVHVGCQRPKAIPPMLTGAETDARRT